MSYITVTDKTATAYRNTAAERVRADAEFAAAMDASLDSFSAARRNSVSFAARYSVEIAAGTAIGLALFAVLNWAGAI